MSSPAHTHHSHHHHDHRPRQFGRAFAIGIGLNIAFVCVEAIYGLSSQSLALLSDAGHNLSDVLGLVLAWTATVLVRRLPTRRRTYGLRRSSILASLVNALLLLLATAAIAWQAVVRLQHPRPIDTGIVMLVAAIGIVVNGATAALFMAGRRHDTNIRAAFLHMAADTAVSAGVVVAALAMRATGWSWLDPVVSLAIVVVISLGTWGLLRDSVNLALDAVPQGIDRDAIEDYLSGLPGVIAVHDLHIWGISTTEAALTVHLVKPDASIDDALLGRINADLHRQFGIDHVTVQFELGDDAHPCRNPC